MTDHPRSSPVVFTQPARCRDCYRCVRVCPVKAIRMHDGQASVDAERCLGCGTCIRECPQQAKAFRSDIDRVRTLLRAGGPVAATVAPALAAAFEPWQILRLPSALRALGFTFIAETAVGATATARASADWIQAHRANSPLISACPAVVRWIERYQPDAVPRLIPVASPMAIHGRHLKRRLGPHCRVVFIGPCVAKKLEIERLDVRDAIDAVLTFRELAEWMQEEKIDFRRCEESQFDESAEALPRHFARVGGALHAAGLSEKDTEPQIISVSGYEDLAEALTPNASPSSPGVVIEPLFCRQGCLNGPAGPADLPLLKRRHRLQIYTEQGPSGPLGQVDPTVSTNAAFAAQPVSRTVFSAEDLRRVLAQTGKTRPDDELNCGACGYPSCREKALGVLEGLAEPAMCIPFTRRQAEQRTDRIIETSPNGIVILDADLRILSMNPAFRRFFMCTDSVCGKPIAYLIDPDLLDPLATGALEFNERVATHEAYGLVCHELFYALRAERQYVGIFVNITSLQTHHEKLQSLRAQTLQQAEDLLEHQLQMARQIAEFLGDSTAKGEMLVNHLRTLASDSTDPEPEQNISPWRKRFTISK
jgi:iron only hydrogenase large subunit-like protein